MELPLPSWRTKFGWGFLAVWMGLMLLPHMWRDSLMEFWLPWIPDPVTLGMLVGLFVIHPFTTQDHLSPFARRHMWATYLLWTITFVFGLGIWIGAPLYRNGLTEVWGMTISIPLWGDMIPVPILLWMLSLPLGFCYIGLLQTKAELEGRNPWDEYREIWKGLLSNASKPSAGS